MLTMLPQVLRVLVGDYWDWQPTDDDFRTAPMRLLEDMLREAHGRGKNLVNVWLRKCPTVHHVELVQRATHVDDPLAVVTLDTLRHLRWLRVWRGSDPEAFVRALRLNNDRLASDLWMASDAVREFGTRRAQ
jgi:hypothetical protein